ncbi:uncharacterized protein N7496_012644 [Penicillium cataractarum]|uniref:J domain-containing protein n=1 Tax=Penicillium cataractarum TaxID=2100454 RepID=A0A9W9R870_9EURO|nr:uncharacterized protein N7496_012644 [Penicillium cataractarum]KAJ5355432.1 hypothetical protein N7496_012644 [Penicillium cataractarum]
MPPPRTNPLFLLQCPQPTSLPSSPRVIHGNRRTLTRYHRTSTRPTRTQHHHTTHPSLLHAQSKSFSTSVSLRKEQNHYEILDVPITATPAEIKKKFYSLSLRHHPDRNRTDPTASQRFAKISSAYSILSNPQKRSTYDRDNGFHRAHVHNPHSPYPQGSHSSHSANLHKGSHGGGGYAGSRPASGLSNRRGTFRGPPPSFYAQGGYGETGRRGDGYAAGKAGPSAGAGGGFGSTSSAGSGSGGTAGTGKQADPEDPMGFIDRNPLGHFNARGHFRTQKAEDARRRERISKARSAARETADSFIGSGDFGLFRFVVVCGILVAAGAMTGLFQIPVTSSGEDGKSGKKRKDGVSSS